MLELSFVIPVYNSQDTIEEVVRRIENTVDKMGVKNYEIILVNDASRDRSLEVAKGICKKNQFVRVINLSRNFGQLNALMAGFNDARGEYVFCMDDDLQVNPEDSALLLKTLLEGNYDVVMGEYEAKKQSLFRKFGSWMNEKMANYLINKPEHLQMSSFIVFRRFVIDEIVKYRHAYPYTAGLIFRTTQNVGTVAVSHRERASGFSNYTFKKLFSIWLNGFTSFSVKPLRVSSIFGFIISMVSFVWAAMIVLNKLQHPEIQLGWTSLMVVFMLLGGIQLLSIGLLGEYIGRVYLCLNRTPQYVIREVLNAEDGPNCGKKEAERDSEKEPV